MGGVKLGEHLVGSDHNRRRQNVSAFVDDQMVGVKVARNTCFQLLPLSVERRDRHQCRRLRDRSLVVCRICVSWTHA